MLASRIVKVANDLLAEYHRFEVLALIQLAVNLASERGSITDANYRQRSSDIHNKAGLMGENTIFRQYPAELHKFIADSDYSQLLPSVIARKLVAAFPADKNMAITSSELQLLLQTTNMLASELASINRFGNRFKVEPVTIPEGLVAIDISVPRAAFDNDARKLSKFIGICSTITERLSELVTGTEERAELVYTSTSDPVTSIAITGAVAYGFLKLYERLLDIAIKQVDLYKALKTLKQEPAFDIKGFEATVTSTVEKQLQAAVDAVLASLPKSIEEGRANEVAVAIGKSATPFFQFVANGTRISVSVESLDRIELMADPDAGISADQVKREIIDLKKMGHTLDRATASLGVDVQHRLEIIANDNEDGEVTR